LVTDKSPGRWLAAREVGIQRSGLDECDFWLDAGASGEVEYERPWASGIW